MYCIQVGKKKVTERYFVTSPEKCSLRDAFLCEGGRREHDMRSVTSFPDDYRTILFRRTAKKHKMPNSIYYIFRY